jgi:hypothetical protein
MSRAHGSINRRFLTPDLSAPASCFNICVCELTLHHPIVPQLEVQLMVFCNLACV